MSKKKWEDFASKLNARYIKKGMWDTGRVEYTYKNWTYYLDSYMIPTGTVMMYYTRIRAPFINEQKFNFSICKEGFFSNLYKKLGMQDIETGYTEFDNKFIIKSNNELMIKRILEEAAVRDSISALEEVQLTIENIKDSKLSVPESSLLYTYNQMIDYSYDVTKVESVFNVFNNILDEFVKTGVTIEDGPKAKLFK